MKSLLQTKAWADFRVTQGWQADNVDGVFVLSRDLFLGKTFLYSPEVNFSEIKNIENFVENIKKIANPPAGGKNSIFFRLEILEEKDIKIIEKLKENGFIKAFEEVQPECRQVIDISGTEEEIFSAMKEKGRYNTRIAQKKGVTVESSSNVDEFYRLFKETADRDGFSIRPKSYFQKLLDNLGVNGYAELLEARFEGKVIAAEIVTYFDETASYLYGASGNEFRNVMAPYLIHFEAMKKAKAKGCKYYDLLAVAPEGVEHSVLAADVHKYAGISRFKRQFGGRTVEITGGYDFVFQPFWYKLFKFLEKIRRK
ncbi:TPA: peptidoglycan bridge formation glycyltransferase FemA/FemB family protein [Candidatus Berkelbacteria bacterium]|uniref:Methicillin resistance protein n=1 Tax=Berkelbacteria bacterium GW2011_GWE1_39_12 TaxID=1618337 RepID=A0A0G4B383_9BACT|nr:MAG: hypothetical protein UT28_C0001G0494 [Berkelbacteria bacterium GW2011_GWE1_39_12]HBO60890.1 peptidoglycan bridge formation glycyltransferase FemA/FemB family protein [Candidatus Berkelbacteria bacterium]